MPLETFPSHQAMLRDKRVLVVEDEALVALLIEDGLLDQEAKVVGPASSVEQALRLIDGVMAEGGLSAAVLDVNLNGEAVLPVADRLAALGVPFLFATGYGECCNTGGHVAPILSKPFDPSMLITAIAHLTSDEDEFGILRQQR
jgi:CheY-like chemotaxis protein